MQHEGQSPRQIEWQRSQHNDLKTGFIALGLFLVIILAIAIYALW